MKQIELSHHGVSANLSVFLFKEGEVFHAYCPELDLFGYDYTEQGARESFDYVLKDYFDFTISRGTLEQDLLAHGWRRSKDGEVSKPTPATLLRNGHFKDVLRKSEFRKYSVPVML